ncbi:MAG TPA: lipoyl(octanoyl) transferase LipB [Gemmatimonadaceae bacterium]
MTDHHLDLDYIATSATQSSTGPRELWVVRLGTIAYGEALELQRTLAAERITGSIPQDILLLLEHPPVVTLGRSAKKANLVASADYLRSRGVEVFEVERGGDVTFHGPGQLVGYPIFDLRRHKPDLHWYLRQVEQALIDSLRTYEIEAERSSGFTGVWTNGRKIASIGVHVRDWVTWHGFALNVTTDLSYFELIVPCGIDGVTMTSIERERGFVEIEDVGSRVAEAFGRGFNLQIIDLGIEQLTAELRAS